MSYKVTEEIADRAQAKHGARNVLWAIGEVAYHDGVGWLPQGPETNEKSIAFRAKLSERQVRRAIVRLQELDEIEVRIAQVGRRRFYVYRLIIGRFRLEEVDHDRLPNLTSRFWTPDELLLPRPDRRPDEKPATTGQSVRSSEIADAAPRPDEMSGRHDDADALTGGHQRPSRPDISCRDDRTSAPGQRARVKTGPVQRTVPKNGPAADPLLSEAVAHNVDSNGIHSAAALLGQPPSLPAILSVLERFARADFGSLRVVEPLAVRLPADVFAEVAERALARKASNDVGLLVTLLRDKLQEREAELRGAIAAAAAAHAAEHEGRRQRNPRTYLHQLLALPHPASGDVVADFLERWVADEQLRAELAGEELRTRAETSTAAGALRHWIRWRVPELDPAHAAAQLDEFLELYRVDDVERADLRDQLQASLDDAAAAASPSTEAAA